MTTPQAPLLILKDFLPYRLSVLSNRISDAIAARYSARFNLKIQEWRVMAVLGEKPDLSAAEISERTAMDKVAVSRAVKSMLASDHLERHFSESDRRRSVIALSEKGREVYAQIVPLALAYEEAILDKMSDEMRACLRPLLRELDDIQLHTLDISENN